MIHSLFCSDEHVQKTVLNLDSVVRYVKKIYNIDPDLVDICIQSDCDEMSKILFQARLKFCSIHPKKSEHSNLIQGKCLLPYENFFLIRTCNEKQNLHHYMIVQNLKND